MQLSTYWIIALLCTVVILRVFFPSKLEAVNPIVTSIDNTIFQLQSRNTELSTLVSTAQQTITTLDAEIATQQATIITLQQQLDAIIQQQSEQVVDPPPLPILDPELVLLVDLRDELLTYLEANVIPTTVYLKTDPLYVYVDGLIGAYLLATQLTLGQFLSTYSDAQVQQFRQDIDTIYNALTYNFDAFLASIQDP